MSDMQQRTCEIVMKTPDDILKPFFELLAQMMSLNGDAYESDLEYFKSIPGYWESVQEAMATPFEECIDEKDVEW